MQVENTLALARVFGDVDPEIAHAGNDLEYCAEIGLVFDPGRIYHAAKSIQKIVSPRERKQLESLFRSRRNVLSGARDLRSFLAKNKRVRLADKGDEAILSPLFDYIQQGSRVMALKLRQIDHIDATSISARDDILPQADTNAIGVVDNVMHLLLEKVPMPKDDVAWEKIIEFREDAEAKGFLHGLRVWAADLAQQKLSRSEIEQKLEWLLFQRRQHLRSHKIAYNLDALGSILVTSAEILEDLLKIKWGKAARGVISLAHRKTHLMKLEMDSPGKEIEYLLKAEKAFGTA